LRDVYVIGAHTIKFGKYLDTSIKILAQNTFMGSLKDAGLEIKDIEALWFSNSGWGESGQTAIRGQVALRAIGVNTIPITNVENACASGSTAFHHAWASVAGEHTNIAMAVGAEKIYHTNPVAVFAGFIGGVDVENILTIAAGLTDFQMTDEDQKQVEAFQAKYKDDSVKPSSKSKKKKDSLWKKFRDNFVVGIMMGEKLGYKTIYELNKLGSADHSPFMDIYGYAARQHMKEYGSTIEQLAMVASKSHHNSTLNPNAQYTFEVSIKDVLLDRVVSWPITRSMCAPIGDGAASAIVCSKEVVDKLGLQKQAVKVRASILGSGKVDEVDFTQPSIGERLSKLAYEKAGVGPEDISFAEVHDATAFGEICQVENLGFCPKGEGGIFAETGATKLDGSKPINTSGGLLSRGHPIGASGLAQIHELFTQLRGVAGDRQVKNPKLGMAENGGGALGGEEAAMCMHIFEAPSKK